MGVFQSRGSSQDAGQCLSRLLGLNKEKPNLSEGNKVAETCSMPAPAPVAVVLAEPEE
jgi:hypothetical protein